MALSDPAFSSENLSRTKTEMENLLSDPTILAKAQAFRSALSGNNTGGEVEESSSELTKVLDCIIKTCQCYTMPPEAKAIREETASLESQLEMARNGMTLGYVDPNQDGQFVAASSVGLRNKLSTDADEGTRRAVYEGLCTIGPFVIDHGLLDIIKLRNKLAKALGFEDYYDYKVTNAEGFGKAKLFAMLDGLEKGTRPIMAKAREEFAKRYGDDGLEPWNMSYKMSGSIVVKMDPYFPFSKAVERYVRSYGAMNITYQGATMNLDLLDRTKKYSNGFCHWPRVAWKPMDKPFVPSVANFTSLADPAAVGSGLTALRTLMHEAGVSRKEFCSNGNVLFLTVSTFMTIAACGAFCQH
jgi:oligoendopeptidase F